MNRTSAVRQAATDSTNGRELWTTDGTSSGTTLFKDINSGSGNSSPNNQIIVNGTLFFTASDGSNGTELWKSDGTTGGTVMVKDINSGSSASSPFGLVNVNNTLFFFANDGTNGVELWKSDGSSSGTVLVKDINTGGSAFGSTVTDVVNGSELFFMADDGTHGNQLWKSDGTSSGTVMVKLINTGGSALASASSGLTVVNGNVLFWADDGTHGLSLWQSDGTEAGTILAENGNGGAITGVNISYNGMLVFYNGFGGSDFGIFEMDFRPTDIYYSAEGQVVEERDASDQVNNQYVWSPVYINSMVERDRDTNNNGTLDQRLYATTDANYDVTALIDTDGVVVERYQYDPYGAPTVLEEDFTADSDNISDVGWVYLFQGGRYDSATKTVHFGTDGGRDEYVSLGTWGQPDNGGGYVDGMNLYQFESSSPVNHVDPLGKFRSDVHFRLTNDAGHALGMNNDSDYRYLETMAMTDVMVDVHNLTDPKFHAQSPGWDGIVRRIMKYVENAISYTAQDAQYVAAEMGVALHVLQDFFSHTDWIDGPNMRPIYAAHNDTVMLAESVKHSHPTHQADIISMADLASGNVGTYNNIVYFEDGLSGGYFDSSHRRYSLDDAGYGRDSSGSVSVQLAGVTYLVPSGIPGAFQHAYNLAGEQSLVFIRWAKDHMKCSTRRYLFGS